jgi:pimeloyl-ACP methyl ester carboxylesterase
MRTVFLALILGMVSILRAQTIDTLAVRSMVLKEVPAAYLVKNLSAAPTPVPDPGLWKQRSYRGADGHTMALYHHASKSRRKTHVVWLHGVRSSGAELAQALSGVPQDAPLEFWVPDLRGHGQEAGLLADLSAPDQYAADIAALIHSLKKRYPKDKVLLAGHSMGGGVALRALMYPGATSPDGLLLLAPLLGHDAPIYHQTKAGASAAEAPYLHIHFERIIGMKLLEAASLPFDASLPVLFFHPSHPKLPLQYSYRSNQAMAPDDFAKALQHINVPALLLIGSEDEAFSANAYPPIMKKHAPEATCTILPGLGHNDLLTDPQLWQNLQGWMITNGFQQP